MMLFLTTVIIFLSSQDFFIDFRGILHFNEWLNYIKKIHRRDFAHWIGYRPTSLPH